MEELTRFIIDPLSTSKAEISVRPGAVVTGAQPLGQDIRGSKTTHRKRLKTPLTMKTEVDLKSLFAKPVRLRAKTKATLGNVGPIPMRKLRLTASAVTAPGPWGW